MNLSSFPKYAFIFLLTLTICPALHAATTYTLTRGGATTSSESTTLSIPDSWQNKDVLTLYSNITVGGQLKCGFDAAGSMTIKSGNTTRYTLTASGTGYRFTDFANGTYNLENVAFSNFGPQNGAIFYRNDGEGCTSTYNLTNVLIEGCSGMYCSAFRAFEKMTISGTGEFKNNTNTYSDGAVLLTQSGSMLLTGDATNLTFTGTKYKDEDGNLSVGYDLNASNITFEGTGTYSLGGGIRSGGTVTINGSNVTLTADSKSYINGKTLLQAGTLTIESANYKTSTVEVSDGATLYLKNTLPSGLTNNGKTVLYTATPTITNLASTATTGTFEWDSSVTGTKSLTLNNTADTTYAGALPDVSSITKPGTNSSN